MPHPQILPPDHLNGKHDNSPERKRVLPENQFPSSDRVEIGCPRYVDGAADDSGSWADLRAVIGDIKWLVPEWVPYRMLCGLIAQPKIGKSAFALDALVKPVITGSDWFNGCEGLGEPGYVVWCDTE